MAYISNLEINGFKSFHDAKTTIKSGNVAITGACGSGKTNVACAVRFVLGETSLKALMSSRVTDLINVNSKRADVMIQASSNGKKITIKRSINNEGKTGYWVDGKHVPRTSAIEMMSKFGMGANSVGYLDYKQLRIFNNPEEVKALIDSCANVCELECATEALSDKVLSMDYDIVGLKYACVDQQIIEQLFPGIEKMKERTLAMNNAYEAIRHARSEKKNISDGNIDATIKRNEELIDKLSRENLESLDMFIGIITRMKNASKRLKPILAERNEIYLKLYENRKTLSDALASSRKGVNDNFRKLSKIVFGKEFQILSDDGITFKLVVSGKKNYPLHQLNGSEIELLSIILWLSVKLHSKCSIFIMDEAGSSLDTKNLKKLNLLLKHVSRYGQIILVTHVPDLISNADEVICVEKKTDGSKFSFGDCHEKR